MPSTARTPCTLFLPSLPQEVLYLMWHFSVCVTESALHQSWLVVPLSPQLPSQRLLHAAGLSGSETDWPQSVRQDDGTYLPTTRQWVYYYYTVKWELFDCHAIFKANTHSPTLKSYASSMYRYICIIVNATSWIHCDFIPRNKVAAAIYYETLLIPDTVQCSWLELWTWQSHRSRRW